MHHHFWQSRWDAGQIGFHRTEVDAHLQRHADTAWPDRVGRALVPLCGKSLDLAWLATRFDEVIGVEFVARAAETFFAELGVAPTVATGSAAGGAAQVLAHGQVAIRVQDFLTVAPSEVGTIDAVWDRAALIALPPDVRAAYADRLALLMRPGAAALVQTFDYPQHLMSGPPFAVADDEVVRLFSPHARLERLERAPVTERRPAALADDVAISTSTWLVTRS